MKTLGRRHLATLLGALGGAVLLRSLFPGRAHAQGNTILAKQVPEVPVDPASGEWQKANLVEIPLSPQLVVKPRLYKAGVSRLKVRSLYDGAKVGFLLEWGDQGEEKGIGKTTSSRDAVALQFPAEPSKPIPYFGMGQPGNPVVIYQWKADWQFAPDYDVNEEYPEMWWDYYPFSGKPAREMVEAIDYASKGTQPFPADKVYIPAWWAGNPLADPELKRRTPVEKLTASGFGSLTSVKEQDGEGKGGRQGEGWQVVMAVPRRQASFELGPGMVLPINFAVWDGKNNERGGEKGVSTWNWLALEKPVGLKPFVLPVALLVGVGFLEWVIVRRLRRSPAKSKPLS